MPPKHPHEKKTAAGTQALRAGRAVSSSWIGSNCVTSLNCTTSRSLFPLLEKVGASRLRTKSFKQAYGKHSVTGH